MESSIGIGAPAYPGCIWAEDPSSYLSARAERVPVG